MKALLKILFALATLLLLGGCLSRTARKSPSYYVLDYKPATENPDLRGETPFPKALEVLDAEVNRTYSRNQLVVRENYSKVRYLPFDLWANRLNDAVPNLIVQRLRAYNIFRQVDRSTGEIEPDYYLETNILNLEKIQGKPSRAYLRLVFYVRDATTQNILLTYEGERYKDLPDADMVYLIQSFNEILMAETDVLAARLRLFLEGRQVQATAPEKTQGKWEDFIYEQAAESAQMAPDGELLLRLAAGPSPEIRYSIEGINADGSYTPFDDGEFNKIATLPAGKYRIKTGEIQEINIRTEIRPRMRTIIEGKQGDWAELVVRVMDESRTRVRQAYDVWQKNPDEYDYQIYGRDVSLGDDDLGQPDKVWILRPGTYMVKIGGGDWNDLRNFTTVNMSAGDSEVLTMVVDPAGGANLLLGAGVLGEKEIVRDRPIVHKGAIHGNISLTGNNNVDRDEPVYNLNVTGQLENNLEATFPFTRISTRSTYDVGLNKDTDSDIRVSSDAWSLKNILLLTPWERKKDLRNFSIYGRGDLQTHFFNEYSYFSAYKNLLLISSGGDSTLSGTAVDRLKTKTSFYPMRLKEGTGITYRFVFSPKVSLSLRCGYGWQQELNRDSYKYTGDWTNPSSGTICSVYKETPDQYYHGIESTAVLSAINIFDFIGVNSTFDVLFPMGSQNRSTRFDSENRVNFRLYRNISLDVKFNVQYDESQKEWVVYDYGSYLRLSLYF
ncbi:MAG TPA: ABC-type transport auxiliary lipoprotein family protein [Candidatus Syntrophosphaera sp.]|nr:ABC-type transport auxiliary lipoprotein family protein [Candidatus Syntrophosphaera sp.]